MERSISMESWEEMQRHGQGFIAEKFNSLAQGLGCMLQSHIRSSTGVCVPQADDASRQEPQSWGIRLNLPWPFMEQQQQQEQRSENERERAQISGKGPLLPITHRAPEISSAFLELGNRLGQARADLGACVGGFVGHVVNQFHKAPPGLSSGNSLPLHCGSEDGLAGGTMEWKDSSSDAGVMLNSWQSPTSARQRRMEEGLREAHVVTAEAPASYEASREELVAAITKSSNQFHKQSSITVTTTYDSRTQDIESSVVARGDLWRAEASHGGASSSNGSSPLFLLQIGPILFVRDTTLLLPIHLSKRHLLWYGFDRKNGLHSLCPAIWSKHRRWLLMSMICLNPLACSFMDLQFPNGQMTYVAGEGVSGSAFLPVYGGLLQLQGRHPGESKLSFSIKNQCGTRICPSLHLPEKSVSVGVTQPLAWQRSGLMLRPTVQLSVTPTFGGRNAGWRAEVVHSPKEKLSVACGCSPTLEPSAFASISVGRSKRNGEHTGSSGLVLQVETPLENLRRASFSLQLSSSVEF
ncbi:uncharacterized protein LOC9642884 [Selaginella moellendorffii]|nr:uncharacterized protein LOC9642884 [Selaginella moellendorffii]|eukprot:XP_002986940.2 uncharacterized protein LOC9642884 [Selaginella moellendorffii]